MTSAAGAALPAGIYTRISSDPEDTRLGVERQEKDCRDLAARRGWEVVDVYPDNDLSAAGRKRRPQYERLLGDIRAGRVRAVVTWDADRLHRRPKELEEFFEACDEAGIRHLATVGGDIDLATGDGQLTARIKGAVAAEEVKKISKRVKRKKQELAEAGKPSGGGSRPFGFKAGGLEHEPAEAKLIRAAARRVLAGETLRGICREWNDAGVRGTGGRVWVTTTLRNVLLSARIAGIREHKGVKVADAVWKPIIDRDTHEKLRALLLDPTRRVSPGRPRARLLTGLLRCGLCGSKMVARPNNKAPGYACVKDPPWSGCGRIAVKAEAAEEILPAMAFAAVDAEDFEQAWRSRQKTAAPESSEVLDALRRDEERLSELAGIWADGEISRAEWLRARKRLQDRVESNRRLLAQCESARATANLDLDDLEERWDGMSLEQRRVVLDALIDRIDVKPATRGRHIVDPARFDVTWRV